MKLRKLIIFLLLIFLVTGCTTSSKTSLEDILKEDGYSCLKGACTKSKTIKGEEKLTYTFDINSKTYELTQGFTNYSTTSKAFDYNWDTKEIKLTALIASIDFVVEGNRDDEELSCTSSSTDKLFVNAECNDLKLNVTAYLEEFDSLYEKIEK